MTEMLTMPVSIDLTSEDVDPVVRCGYRYLCELRPGSASERLAADFIRRRFNQAYGARPILHMPPLLALVSDHGTLLAAVGVRCAAVERLFLENYLDQPVQNCLPGSDSDRTSVVEIAHLAGVETGISRPLFAALAVWLQRAGLRWVACTGTAQLRNGFGHIGIKVSDLGVADPDRLAGAGQDWGTYYDNQPRVLVINVSQGVESLKAYGLLRQVRFIEPGGTGMPVSCRAAGRGYGKLA
ncbi:MAG: thermostable hemolysin [Marinobacter sp.]|nr:thermostable hemolysin [Marinobacter sp.]